MTPSYVRNAYAVGKPRQASTCLDPAASEPGRRNLPRPRHRRPTPSSHRHQPGASGTGSTRPSQGGWSPWGSSQQGDLSRTIPEQERFSTAKVSAMGSPVNMGLPARFEAVGEALASGSDSADACAVVGRDLARDGASLHEGLEALRTTYQRVRGVDPAYDDVLALSLAWSESTLGYLHQISCADPMTGLASLAHLRSRLADLYRGQGPEFGRVRHRYALVVADLPGDRYGAEAETDPLTRSLRLSRLGEAARTVFAGAETVAGAGHQPRGCPGDPRQQARPACRAAAPDGRHPGSARPPGPGLDRGSAAHRLRRGRAPRRARPPLEPPADLAIADTRRARAQPGVGAPR